MPTTYFPFRWMVGTFQEILDSSSGNWVRIKSMTDLRVFSFIGSTEAKYSSTELNLGDFFFPPPAFVARFFIEVFKRLASTIKVSGASCAPWIGAITLNVAHESPSKSSAR